VFRAWPALAGVLVIAFALREVFKDLFQPSAAGDLSNSIGKALFRTARRFPSILPTMGPLSVLVVIFCWILLLTLGFGLVYWAGFPDNFHFSPAPEKADRGGFLTALYFSLETLTTLGLGEITPRPGWTRWAAVAEALLGLSLFTASISWFVLLYPALGRLRTLARHASILARAGESTGVDVIGKDAESMLAELANEVIRTRVDFVHFPVVYYFYSGSEHASLPRALKLLLEYSELGVKEGNTERVRFAAATLDAALDDLAKLLARNFLHMDPVDKKAVFQAYAKDHLASD
jgi:hypothetical protein